MHILFKILVTLLCASAPIAAGAQRFHSMKVMKEGDFMSAPVIRLGSDDRISINFDEWSDDFSELRCRLVHCGPDWKPSRLLESEYLDGFNFADIDDWALSSGTFTGYVNYQLFIPDERLSPKVSGNYILEIFHRDDPDEVLGEARFSVAEQSAQVRASVSSQTDRGHNSEWQQLEIEVIPSDVRFDSPFSDVRLLLLQNNDPATLREIDTPSRLDGSTLIYAHQPQLIFKAGNEFRRFESIRTDYPDMHVDSVRYIGPVYHVWLTPDTQRADAEYSYDQTQQGRFIVRQYNATDSDLGADYVTAHFTLDTPDITGADVYVAGEFTGYRYDESTRMRYDYNAGVYRLELPVKQGSYNYRYVAIPRDGDREPDPSLIEGNKYETRNEYRIQIWYNPPGSRYSRLITDTTLYP